MLCRVMNKEQPDEEFSIAQQYRTPLMFVQGIAHEAVITRIGEFDNIAKGVKDVQAIRAELEFALSTVEAVRLVPVR